jgi:hypothetical protein
MADHGRDRHLPPTQTSVARLLLVLVIGVAAGYRWGYRDARTHDRPVVERVLDRAGASARGKYDQDVDRAAQRVEDR